MLPGDQQRPVCGGRRLLAVALQGPNRWVPTSRAGLMPAAHPQMQAGQMARASFQVQCSTLVSQLNLWTLQLIHVMKWRQCMIANTLLYEAGHAAGNALTSRLTRYPSRVLLEKYLEVTVACTNPRSMAEIAVILRFPRVLWPAVNPHAPLLLLRWKTSSLAAQHSRRAATLQTACRWHSLQTRPPLG